MESTRMIDVLEQEVAAGTPKKQSWYEEMFDYDQEQQAEEARAWPRARVDVQIDTQISPTSAGSDEYWPARYSFSSTLSTIPEEFEEFEDEGVAGLSEHSEKKQNRNSEPKADDDAENSEPSTGPITPLSVKTSDVDIMDWISHLLKHVDDLEIALEAVQEASEEPVKTLSQDNVAASSEAIETSAPVNQVLSPVLQVEASTTSMAENKIEIPATQNPASANVRNVRLVTAAVPKHLGIFDGQGSPAQLPTPASTTSMPEKKTETTTSMPQNKIEIPAAQKPASAKDQNLCRIAVAIPKHFKNFDGKGSPAQLPTPAPTTSMPESKIQIPAQQRPASAKVLSPVPRVEASTISMPESEIQIPAPQRPASAKVQNLRRIAVAIPKHFKNFDGRGSPAQLPTPVRPVGAVQAIVPAAAIVPTATIVPATTSASPVVAVHAIVPEAAIIPAPTIVPTATIVPATTPAPPVVTVHAIVPEAATPQAPTTIPAPAVTSTSPIEPAAPKPQNLRQTANKASTAKSAAPLETSNKFSALERIPKESRRIPKEEEALPALPALASALRMAKKARRSRRNMKEKPSRGTANSAAAAMDTLRGRGVRELQEYPVLWVVLVAACALLWCLAAWICGYLLSGSGKGREGELRM